MAAGPPPIVEGLYSILTQSPTVDLIGPGVIQNVIEVTVVELPHQVSFEVRVPTSYWRDGLAEGLIRTYAQQVQAIMEHPYVIDAAGSQRQTAAGRLLSLLTIFVSPDDGANSASFEQSFDKLDLYYTGPLIDYYVGILNATQQGTATPSPPTLTATGASAGGSVAP